MLSINVTVTSTLNVSMNDALPTRFRRPCLACFLFPFLPFCFCGLLLVCLFVCWFVCFSQTIGSCGVPAREGSIWQKWMCKRIPGWCLRFVLVFIKAMLQFKAVPLKMLAARYAVLNNDFVLMCKCQSARSAYIYISFIYINDTNNVLHLRLHAALIFPWWLCFNYCHC